jgi:hypothetical protein
VADVNGEHLNVLLIVERPGTFAAIARRLEEKNACRCLFVHSYAEAKRLVQSRSFDLILSAIPPRNNAISSLAETLAGTRASVFYAHPVEDGCWWLPALRNGLQCFGTPALRPREFSSLLDQVVEEAQGRGAFGEKPPVPAFRPTHNSSGTDRGEPAHTHSVATT